MAVYKLKAGGSGYFLFDKGQGLGYLPYPRGAVLPIFNTDDSLETLALRYSHYDLNNIMRDTLYSDIENGNTGAVFADFSELVGFVENYIIGNATGYQKSWQITTVVVNPFTQKLNGMTLQDDSYIGQTPKDILYIGGQPMQWKTLGITFDSITGTWDFTAIGGIADTYVTNDFY